MSTTNTMSEVTEITNPELRSIAERVVKEVTLAIHKVTAHSAEPENYPLPQDPNSVEQILQKRFTELRPEQKQRAMAKVFPLVKESKAQREIRFGDLHQVDLRSAIPVAQQAAALPFSPALQLQLETLPTIDELHPEPVPERITDGLELRIHKVKAVDETGSWTEWGSDEIYLGGTTVDESGDTHQVSTFKVDEFDDGDVKTYSPPKRFASFDLREGTEFPKSYFVTLVLAEVDQGGLPGFIEDLSKDVQKKVKDYVTAAVGGWIGASGGPVGVAIGLAVGYAVGEIFDLLKEVWEDEIFTPKTISVKIGSLAHRFVHTSILDDLLDRSTFRIDSPQAVVRFEGHDGTYEVTYDWQMYTRTPLDNLFHPGDQQQHPE